MRVILPVEESEAEMLLGEQGAAGRRTRLSIRLPDRNVAAALVLLYVSWGSTYVAFKISFSDLPPLLSTGVRFTLAGLLLLTIAHRKGMATGRARSGQLRSALILGFLMVGLGAGAVVIAVPHLSTGTTALAQASVPMFVALGDRIIFRARLERRALVGLLLGFAGIIALAGPAGGEPGGLGWIGLVILGSAGFAAGALVSRVLPLGEDRLAATGLQMLLGGLMVAGAGVMTGDVSRLHVLSLRYTSVLAWFYLLLVSALIGFSLYMWLLGAASATVVATTSYIDPVIALVFGWALLGEGLSVRSAVSALVIVAAAALIVTCGSTTAGAATAALSVPDIPA
jgi:drug/metabolite transporter (DMT)-like permease